ncbi:50S ribosomal protein L35ae [Candidatus Bathyarchaeota archaeon]|nr:MAG: 50S ribosomal protein L35ae [Candidatus Bathyarchaeota archaeon]
MPRLGESALTSPIKGVVVNYRVGPKTQRTKECIIQFAHAKTVSEASRLIGRKVAWITSKNNKIIGKIVALHGKKGLVRARFRKGLPGQALGTTVELIG